MKDLIREWKIFNSKNEIKYQIDLIESMSYDFEKNYFNKVVISYLKESAEESSTIESEVIRANGILSKIAGNKKLKGILGIGMILVMTKLGYDNITNMTKENPSNLKPAIEDTVNDLEQELPEEYRSTLAEMTPLVVDAIGENVDAILARKAELESIDLNILKDIFKKKVKQRKRTKTNLNKKSYKVSGLGARITGHGGPSSKVKSGTVKGTSVLPDPSEDQLIEMSEKLSREISADIALDDMGTGNKVIESISVQTQISVQTHTTKAYKKIKESAEHFKDISKRYSRSIISDDDLNERLDKFIDKYGQDSNAHSQVSQLTGLLISCKAHTDMCAQTISALNKGGEFQKTLKIGAGRHTKSVDDKYEQKVASTMQRVVKATNLSIKRYNVLVETVSANYLTLKSKDIKGSRDKLPSSVESAIKGILSSLINEDGSVNTTKLNDITTSITKIGIVTDASISAKISGITSADVKSSKSAQSP